jgi:thioredoxin-related protein
MKQIITIAIILFLSIGCNNAPKQSKQSPIKITKDNTSWGMNNDDVLVIEYDGCEYVRFSGGNDAWGSHKGNCKYCEQRKTTTNNEQ